MATATPKRRRSTAASLVQDVGARGSGSRGKPALSAAADPAAAAGAADSAATDGLPAADAASDASPERFLSSLGLLAHSSWAAVVTAALQSREGRQLLSFVSASRRATTVYPDHADVFSALRLTPLDRVLVVILGQDPYHG